MKIQIDKRLKKTLKGTFEKYDFDVGVLTDKDHYQPKRGVRGLKGQDVLKIYAGGPARMQSRKKSSMNMSQLSEHIRKNLGINYLTEPFKKKSSDIIKFANEFFRLALGKSQKRRCENLLQAIVRNPILRGEYGNNSPLTIKIKGFDRFLIDTAQFFKNITARCNEKK